MLNFLEFTKFYIDRQKATGYNIVTEIKRRKKMKSTGVVRMLDHLGRIVLPIEIRKTMDIKEKDSLEIFTDENKIILTKYQPSCIFCNNVDNVVYFNGKRICADCLKKIKEQL